jgi:tetratricopeptide (TPR) repeat protein
MSPASAAGGFVHLHNHMEGSYSDSALRAAHALDRVAALGMNAFALTDHGEMAMVPVFAAEAAKRGIKPIVGFEAYFVEDAAANIRHRINDRFHLTLLAGNAVGYRNLIRIASRSWSENCLMQKLGLVDWRLLEEHSAGIICLSGCLAGPLGWSIFKDRQPEADRFYGRFSELFGDRYYIEVYDHGMPEERKAVEGLLALAGRYGRPVVLTNDCHYLDPEHWAWHDTLIKTRFGRPSDFELPYHEYYIKSAEEMRRLGFPDEYSDRTIEIAERIALTAEEILSPASLDGPVETAFLGSSRPMGRRRAIEKAAAVHKLSVREQKRVAAMSDSEVRESYPQVAAIATGIQDLPPKPEPLLDRVVVAPALSARVPLRRSEKALFTMWSEADCVRAGAEIRSVTEFPELASLAAATDSYFRGLAEYRKRKFDSARNYFARSLENDPRFTNARYQLGLVEYYSGHIPEARRLFEEVLKEAPEFERLPHLQSYLGWCCFKLDSDEDAIRWFRESLKGKEIEGTLLGFGLALERHGEIDEARRALLRLVEISPDDARMDTAQRALERLGAGAPAASSSPADPAAPDGGAKA